MPEGDASVLSLDIRDEPTLEQVRQWIDILQTEWGSDEGAATGFMSEMTSEEAIYFQDFSIEAPDGKMVVKTGSAPADADAAMDSLNPEDIVVEVKPLTKGNRAKPGKFYAGQAEKLMKFARALWRTWRYPRDELSMVIADMVIRRVGICRVMYDTSKWPERVNWIKEIKQPPRKDDESAEEYEERIDGWDRKIMAWEAMNRAECPIVFERRNPRTTRWRMYRGEMMVVVEDYYTNALEARTMFAVWPKVDKVLYNYSPNDQVHVQEFWKGPWRCILVEEQPIFEINEGTEYEGVGPHGYVKIPYVVAPFRELPFDSPERKYRGMLTNSADLYPMESRILTMNVWMLAWNAWRTYKGWTSDQRPLDIFPGRYIPLDTRKGEYLEMLEGRPVAPEILQMSALADNYIQRNGLSQGPKTQEGARSAQQLWAYQSMRLNKLNQPKKNLASMMQQCLFMAASILETMIGESITMPVPGRDSEGNDYGQVTIGPDDISGYWGGFIVKFTNRLDPAQLEQAKALMAMAVNKWMPLKTSWMLSGLTESPQEWQDELILQATEGLDFMLELIALQRAKTWFGEDSEEYKTLYQKVMASKQTAQPAPGGPGMPGGSGGGMTPPSANAGASGQSAGPGGVSPAGPSAGTAMAQGMRTKTGGNRGGGTSRNPPANVPTGGGR